MATPPDDILLNKAAIIERCLRRLGEEAISHQDTEITEMVAVFLSALCDSVRVVCLDDHGRLGRDHRRPGRFYFLPSTA